MKHTETSKLIRNNDVIIVEDLNLAGMTKRANPKPDPDNPEAYLPNGGSGKTGLNRVMMDAGIGNFILALKYKAENAGRIVIKIDPQYTSQRCSCC